MKPVTGPASVALSIPSKLFFLGEYAVLAGLPAWVTAIAPRFRLEPSPQPLVFHPRSPAGRLLAEVGPTGLSAGSWNDPWSGAGGFGGSTAEFAAVAYRLGLRSAMDAWSSYRRLSESPLSASGADLVAQWMGGTIEWNPETRSVIDWSGKFERLPILYFSATHREGRKTPTHSHLDEIARADNLALVLEKAAGELEPILRRAREALLGDRVKDLGSCLTQYANALGELGWEDEEVRRERKEILKIDGIIGVKGCGARQTDAFVVLLAPGANSSVADRIAEGLEKKFSLKRIASGSQPEPGIREEA